MPCLAPSWRGLARCAALTAALACAATAPVAARTAEEAMPIVAWAELPRDARDCLERIAAGGPYPFERDGVAFGNRERLLPKAVRGYYREYTVAAPGARSRGAKRIVCGGPPRSPDACYYTEDHYRSFRRIRE
jgi:ribonuclease T1